MVSPGDEPGPPDRQAEAIAASWLRSIPPSLLEQLLAGSRIRTDAAGSLVRPIGAGGSHLEVVLTGLIRVEVSSPDGRSLTIRYARPGDLLGAASLFAQRYAMPGSLYALVESELLELRPDLVRRLAREHVEVANALLDELSERVVAFVGEIPGSAFSTVRQRIARQLLHVATEPGRGRTRVARITQQQLADAVGTVREVVVRELRGLREEGIVATGSRSITILDPDRLAADVGDATPAVWNAGS
jgi:CRP/FNR family transcriptional regulator, cyclic AMP receptor protein